MVPGLHKLVFIKVFLPLQFAIKVLPDNDGEVQVFL